MLPGADPVAAYMASTNQSIADIKSTLAKMSDAILTLVRLEAEQRSQAASIKRVEVDIDEHAERIGKIELEMPLLRQTHRWVVTGVLGIIAMVAIQLYDNLSRRPQPVVIAQPAAVRQQ